MLQGDIAAASTCAMDLAAARSWASKPRWIHVPLAASGPADLVTHAVADGQRLLMSASGNLTMQASADALARART